MSQQTKNNQEFFEAADFVFSQLEKLFPIQPNEKAVYKVVRDEEFHHKLLDKIPEVIISKEAII